METFSWVFGGGGVGGIAWPIEVLARLNDEGVHSRDRVLKSARTVDRPARRTGVAGPTASPAGLVSAGRQRGAGPGQPAVAQGPTFGIGKPELGPSVAPKPGRVGGKLNRPMESHSPSDGGPRHTAAKAAPSYEFPLVKGRAGSAWQVGSSGRSAPQGASLMRVWDVADLRWFTGLSLPRWSIEAPRSPLPYPRQVARSTGPIARRRPAVDRGRRRCRTIATSLRAPAEAWSIWEGTSSWLGWPSGRRCQPLSRAL